MKLNIHFCHDRQGQNNRNMLQRKAVQYKPKKILQI